MIRYCDNGHAPVRLVSGTRCPACSRRREAARPDRFARGYGAAHTSARRALRATLPALCAYGCGTTLVPDGDWVAAHVVDGDPSAGWIASCRGCNERAKGRGASESGNTPRAVPAPRRVAGRTGLALSQGSGSVA